MLEEYRKYLEETKDKQPLTYEEWKEKKKCLEH